jgi:hypothetical protein
MKTTAIRCEHKIGLGMNDKAVNGCVYVNADACVNAFILMDVDGFYSSHTG